MQLKTDTIGGCAMLTSVTENQKMAYSVEEISEKTSLSKGYLRNEIRAKRLKAKKFGRRVLVLAEDLEAYLRKEDGNEK
ncbi:MAG TPA: helix-turn-helix domain-containing protein [Pyrinomonadaceae bacterium]